MFENVGTFRIIKLDSNRYEIQKCVDEIHDFTANGISRCVWEHIITYDGFSLEEVIKKANLRWF